MNLLEIIVLFGGFILFLLLVLLLLLPYFRGLHLRYFIISSVSIPFMVGFFMFRFNLFVRGRSLFIMSFIPPLIIPLVAPIISIIKHKRSNAISRGTRFAYILILGVYCLSEIWILLVFWLVTDSGFMGANC